jgi:hypothetical protein
MQHGQVCGRVAANQSCGDGLAAGRAHVDVLVALDDVMGGNDYAVGRPDDTAGRQATPRLHPDHARARRFNRGRQIIR